MLGESSDWEQRQEKAFIVGFNGKNYKEINFSFEDGTGSWMACGVTFQNEFWVFGGSKNNRQVNQFISNQF